MRRLALLAFVAVALISRHAPAQGRKPAKASDMPVAKAKPRSTSVWEPLVTANARFVLLGADNQSSRIVVEVYDARTIKGAKVARLRWLIEEGGARSPMGNSLPTQIAVTKKGAWLLTDRMDDQRVGAALKGKPTLADPPRTAEGDDGYVRKDGDAVCVGVGTPPGKPCAGGICHAEYCLAPGVGLTSVSGNYTPSAGKFVAPRPSEPLSAELRTGIPECDAFLAQWARCVNESVGADMRDQLNEALKQMAAAYRQQATTPDGAKQAANVCREVAPQMNDALRGLGCAI